MSSGSVQVEAPCIIHPPRFMEKDKRKEKKRKGKGGLDRMKPNCYSCKSRRSIMW